jgi:16S rRNA (cytosine967-C5)-methyltransferase
MTAVPVAPVGPVGSVGPVVPVRPVGPVRVVVGCAAAESERVRSLALAAYEEARAARWPFLSDVLERILRGTLDADRAAASATVHALVKYDRLLAFACDGGDAAARFDRLLALAAGEDRDTAARLEQIASEKERLAVTYSFPDWLVDHLEGELGASALERALARMNEVPPRAARVNALVTTRDACLGALAAEGIEAKPGVLAPFAVILEGQRSAFRTQAFTQGAIEMQDEASQLVADVVAPPPGALVVDACAGAGGKALALASLMGGKGRVVALDVSETKLEELRRRARRAGASNVRAIAVDLLAPGDRLGEFAGCAERVLLDAPCSGLGAIRRNPEARWRVTAEELARLVATQAALLDAAAPLVAPRGRLVFATCSFLPSEGERAIEAFLARHSAFTGVTVRDVLGRARTSRVATPDGRFFRTWRFDEAPDDAGVDGFFAGIVRRTAPAS